MPVALLVAVVAVIAMLAACAPRTFQRVRGKIAARIQLRDDLAWRGDTPPGAPVNTPTARRGMTGAACGQWAAYPCGAEAKTTP